MRAGLVALVCAASACSNGTYLNVELSGSIARVDRLLVTVKNRGATRQLTITRDFSLPPAQSFVLSFGAGPSGDTTVGVTAYFQNAQVGYASNHRTLIAGGTATLDLDFNSSADGGAPGALDHFAVTASQLTIAEHASLEVHLGARDASDHPLTSYHGTPGFATDWGDVALVGAVQFSNGEADVAVRFDRETSPPHPSAHLLVSDGAAQGSSQDLTVVAPAWSVVSAAPVFYGGRTVNGWDYNVSNPTWFRSSGQYLLYYTGVSSDATVNGIGLATSPDGTTWTRQSTSAPLFGVAPPGAWDQGKAPFRFSVQPDPTTGNFFAAWFDSPPNGTGVAFSTDGIAWTRAPQKLSITAGTGCSVFYDAAEKVMIEPGKIHLFFENGKGSPCQAVLTSDAQTSATLTPLSGIDKTSTSQLDTVVQMIKEASVYKIWYSQDNGATTLYATSSDGVSFIPSPSGAIQLGILSVLYNEQTGGYEGLIYGGSSSLPGLSRVARP